MSSHFRFSRNFLVEGILSLLNFRYFNTFFFFNFNKIHTHIYSEQTKYIYGTWCCRCDCYTKCHQHVYETQRKYMYRINMAPLYSLNKIVHVHGHNNYTVQYASKTRERTNGNIICTCSLDDILFLYLYITFVYILYIHLWYKCVCVWRVFPRQQCDALGSD